MGNSIPPLPPLPEHEKLTAAKKTDDATQLVGSFVEFLDGKGIRRGHYVEFHKGDGANREYARRVWKTAHNATLAAGVGPGSAEEEFKAEMGFDSDDLDDDSCWRSSFVTFDVSTRDLIAEFFGIDQNKLEDEKRALLEHARQLSAKEART